MISRQDKALERIRSSDLTPSEECPVGAIREVKEDGTEVFIGHVSFSRFIWKTLALNDARETEASRKMQKENDERVLGDPKLDWNIGCEYLH